MSYEILGAFLTSASLQSVVGMVQVVAIVFVLRGMGSLERQGSLLKRMIEEQTALHDVDDPLHPGAKLFWGVGVNSIEQQLALVSERQRVMSDRQQDFVESIKELKKGQGELIVVCSKAVAQMAQREHLIG